MTRKKRVFYTELAYVFGLLFLALGTAFMEAADFGVSMVVAPAYLLYLKLSTIWPAFTFGMAEYLFQFVLLLVLMTVLRRFRISYLLSFATAVFYGLMLDGCMAAVALIPDAGLAGRIIYYFAGLLICALGVALIFHTYIPPEVYELFVKECSEKFGRNVTHVKTAYDCISCAAAVAMSFLFFGFGHFEGVKLGTVFCALVNGWTIGLCSHLLERIWDFRDGTAWRGRLK